MHRTATLVVEATLYDAWGQEACAHSTGTFSIASAPGRQRRNGCFTLTTRRFQPIELFCEQPFPRL
jgi:hypothetical protein